MQSQDSNPGLFNCIVPGALGLQSFLNIRSLQYNLCTERPPGVAKSGLSSALCEQPCDLGCIFCLWSLLPPQAGAPLTRLVGESSGMMHEKVATHRIRSVYASVTSSSLVPSSQIQVLIIAVKSCEVVMRMTESTVCDWSCPPGV